MARKPRFNLPGMPQHVVQRGNNRQPCFYRQQDYRRYKAILEEEAAACDCAVHAFVLMTNHVHILVTPGSEHSLPRMMQRLGARYVRFVNAEYQRTGTLWEGRYKACLVGNEGYLLKCHMYIEMNPVRAGMVRLPDDYCFSSYRANAQGESCSLLKPHALYLELGTTADERCRAYRALFRDLPDAEDLHRIRESLNKELAYGNDRFREQLEVMTSRAVRPGKVGRPKLTDGAKLY